MPLSDKEGVKKFGKSWYTHYDEKHICSGTPFYSKCKKHNLEMYRTTCGTCLKYLTRRGCGKGCIP